LAVTGRIMRGIHGGVVLAQELGAFLLGQVPENDRRVIRVLNLSRLGGHAIQATSGPGQSSGHRDRSRLPRLSGPGTCVHLSAARSAVVGAKVSRNLAKGGRVTMREDAQHLRSGTAPQVMAAVRGTPVAALRLAGFTATSAGRRWAARNPPGPSPSSISRKQNGVRPHARSAAVGATLVCGSCTCLTPSRVFPT
jgi:hypothetical protein